MAPPEEVPFLPSLATEEKTLRPSFIRDEDERPKVTYNQFSNDIPVISLAGIEDDERRAAICRDIVEASEVWGVFQVVDHGIDAEVISDMTRLSTEFFAFPADEKLRFDMSGGKKGGFIVSSPFRGEAVDDWRELVTYFTYPIMARDYSRWPNKPKGWRSVVETYSEKLMGLACKMMEVLSESMGLDKEALTKACIDMDQKVVVNFYPKCLHPDMTLGVRRHTDLGTITFLLQDHVGGLQATKDDGKTWITVRPVEGAFVVNIGDHGHFLSNGRFKSADHRAVVNSNCSRLSIVTFQNPAQEAIVYPLAIQEGEKPVLDEPISYKEMYRRKINQYLEQDKLKMMAKMVQLEMLDKSNGAAQDKALEEILA